MNRQYLISLGEEIVFKEFWCLASLNCLETMKELHYPRYAGFVSMVKLIDWFAWNRHKYGYQDQLIHVRVANPHDSNSHALLDLAMDINKVDLLYLSNKTLIYYSHY